VGIRDLKKPKWTIDNFPGDRRINKDPGAEQMGDYLER